MRREVLRVTTEVAAVVLSLLAIPHLIALVCLMTLGKPQVESLALALSSWLWMLLLLLIEMLLALACLAAGIYLSIRRANVLSRPFRELAIQAERFGAGEARLHPLECGIEEVDRVSVVLSRSAQNLARSLAAEREFAADASHQLRTPLTALLMRLEEIAYTDDIDAVKEEANIAIAQVERLSKVVDELMGRTRRVTRRRPSISLDSVIAALQREWNPAFEHARRSMHVKGERGLRVLATPTALAQMLSTLLENALAHGRGTVEMTARRSGPSVVVEVQDQGVGIDTSLAPHVFERSVSSSGSGLGLALARDLAESNGGRLDLLTAQPAVFALFLSAADE